MVAHSANQKVLHDLQLGLVLGIPKVLGRLQSQLLHCILL